MHKMNAERAALINTIVHVVYFTESSGQFFSIYFLFGRFGEQASARR